MTRTDDAKIELVEQIVDSMVTQMTLEEMRRAVWDGLYEDLAWQSWDDLLMLAEEHAPDWSEE